MIGFRANNRLPVIGTFCNFHVNSKQRQTNEVRVKAAVSGEDRCVTTLITAAKETTSETAQNILVLIRGGFLMTKVPGKCAGYLVMKCDGRSGLRELFLKLRYMKQE